MNRRDFFTTAGAVAATTVALAQPPQTKKGQTAPKGTPAQVPAGRGAASAPTPAGIAIDPAVDSADQTLVQQLGPFGYLQKVQAEVLTIQNNTTLQPNQRDVLVTDALKKYPRAAMFFQGEAEAQDALSRNAQPALSSGQVWDRSFGNVRITSAFEKQSTGTPAQPAAAAATDTKLDAVAKAVIAEKLGDIQTAINDNIAEDRKRLGAMTALENNKSATNKAGKVLGVLGGLGRGNTQKAQPAAALVVNSPQDGMSYVEPAVLGTLNADSHTAVVRMQGMAFEASLDMQDRVLRDLNTIRTVIYSANGGKGAVASEEIPNMPAKDKAIYNAAASTFATLTAVWGTVSGGRVQGTQVAYADIIAGGYAGVVAKYSAPLMDAGKAAAIEPTTTPIVGIATAEQGRNAGRGPNANTRQETPQTINLPGVPYEVKRKIGNIQIPIPRR